MPVVHKRMVQRKVLHTYEKIGEPESGSRLVGKRRWNTVLEVIDNHIGICHERLVQHVL